MLIPAMPAVLQWGEDGIATMIAVHDSYADLLADRLGRTIGRGMAEGIAGAARLHELTAALPVAAMTQFLFAPETSSRLLWPRLYDPAGAMAFLVASAEAAQAGPAPVAQIAGLAPIDFDSAAALHCDLNGVELRLARPRTPLAAAEQAVVLDRIGVAMAAIRASAPAAELMVGLFAKLWLVQPDPDAPHSFSSGTSGQFVGRAVLANAHLATTGVDHIADALVHEAIHGLLYMQEQQRPWVRDDALYGGTLHTVSPWTGTRLPLRPYMQAAFVWYGLAQFWILALQAEHGIARAACTARLAMALSGFLKGDLTDQLAPFADRIAPELIDAIATMQGVIRTAAAQADLVRA